MWIRFSIVGGLVTLAMLWMNAGAAPAAPGDLDPSFGGGDGVQTIGVTPTGQDSGTDVAIQPDGKIVVAGYSDTDPGPTLNVDLVLVRFDAAGNPDPSFGGGDGIVTTAMSAFPGNTDFGLAIALAADGSGAIFVAGQSYTDAGNENSDFAVAKYTSTGALDNSFSGNGKATTAVAPTTNVDAAYSVFVQSDGKVVAGGLADMDPSLSGSDVNFALVRYNSNGTLDATFDGDGVPGNGIVTTPIGPAAGYDAALSVASAPGDRIVAAGSASMGGATGLDGAVVRYLSDGKKDTSFDTDGIRTQAIGPGTNGDTFADAAVYADGRILAAGTSDVGPGNTDGQYALVRFNENGSLDPSFSGDGIQTAGIAPSLRADRAEAIALEPGGKVVAGGSSIMEPDTDRYSLARFSSDGALDTSFAAPAGMTSTAIATDGIDRINGLALQGDGAIVVAGESDFSGGGGQEISLARYLGDPPAATPKGNAGPDSNIDPVSKAVKKAGIARRKRSKPRRFTGTASDDSGVAKVEVALARVGPGSGKLARKHAKKKKRCAWLSGKGKLKRTAAKNGTCAQRWLGAQGTAKWSFKLPKRLPKGRYVLYSRATDNAGLAEAGFSAADRNRISFRVR
jgi:uncharacterized delta-60 repeat protein